MRLVLALLTGLFAYAQQFDDGWRTLAAANPVGARLTLRVGEPHRFHVGEVIPVDVGLDDSKMGAERMYSFGGVLIDPASSSCGSRSEACQVQNILAMIPDEIIKLGKSKEVLHGELNFYVPPLTPGKYRVAILADYFVLTEGKPGKGRYHGPSQAVSNVEEFEIVPVTAEWVAQTVAAARQVLSSPASKTDVLARSRAVHQLRYLQVPEAWQASLDLLSKAPEELLVGLTEAQDKAAVCQLMMSL